MTLDSTDPVIHTDTPRKRWRLPYSDKIMRVIQAFSLTEKVIFYFFVAVFVLSSLTLLYQVNRLFLVQVPEHGGALTEGDLGSPRFVNPILSTSDIDKDITSLIYSGLLKADSTTGKLKNDLAQSCTTSTDGLTYICTVRADATFHDGTPVTADDIVFTVSKAKDINLKSPRKASWDGVRVEKVDNHTVQFILPKAYSPFIQNLTLGILPKHIWNTATDDEFPFSQFNVKPVGSGPYKIESISYAASGLPREYHLIAWNKYAFGEPYITHLTIKSYGYEKELENAFRNGEIQSMGGISPVTIPSLDLHSSLIVRAPLPRIFGVFFNQNLAPVFVYKEVRDALNVAVDKQAIVDRLLSGYGQIENSAIPSATLRDSSASSHVLNSSMYSGSSTENSVQQRLTMAQAILSKAGWIRNSSGIFEKTINKKTVLLSFSISTGDAPDLKITAETLQKQWQTLGAKVQVKIFEPSDLNQNIIRPRKYDALLFGEIIGRGEDLYPFWHSSERTDPGLNIALYTNLKADKILERIRSTTDNKTQQILYDQFNTEIQADTPAVFLYSPYYIYIVPRTVHGVSLGQINGPAERWANISEWYIETNDVWKIFTR